MTRRAALRLLARMAATILITRPEAAAGRLAAALAGAGVAAPVLLGPLMEIVPLVPERDPEAYPLLVFTSANAVAAIGPRPSLAGRPAWCVGAATAEAARAAGLAARAAGGDAEALVAALLAARPAGPALHLRGAHARGAVAARLRRGGLPAEEAVVYDQRALPLAPAARALLGGEEPVVAPLFSPRTARLLAEAGPFRAPLRIVAMSLAVASAFAAAGGRADAVLVAAAPDAGEMLAAMRRALGPPDLARPVARARFSRRGGGEAAKARGRGAERVAQSSDKGGAAALGSGRTFEDPEALPTRPEDPDAPRPLPPGIAEEIARSAADAARETPADAAGGETGSRNAPPFDDAAATAETAEDRMEAGEAPALGSAAGVAVARAESAGAEEEAGVMPPAGASPVSRAAAAAGGETAVGATTDDSAAALSRTDASVDAAYRRDKGSATGAGSPEPSEARPEGMEADAGLLATDATGIAGQDTVGSASGAPAGGDPVGSGGTGEWDSALTGAGSTPSTADAGASDASGGATDALRSSSSTTGLFGSSSAGSTSTDARSGAAATGADRAGAGAGADGSESARSGSSAAYDATQAAGSSSAALGDGAAGGSGVATGAPSGRGGGFWPRALGGALAAALGATAMWFALPRDVVPMASDPALAERLGAQEAALGELEQAVGEMNTALAAGIDGESLEALRADSEGRIAALAADSEGRLAGLDETLTAVAERLGALEAGLAEAGERLAALEARPVPDADATAETIQSGLDAANRRLQAEMTAMRARLEAEAAAAQDELAAAETRATALRAEAEAAGRRAALREALGAIGRALETGAPLAGPLAALEAATGEAPPAPLAAAAEEGVPTLGALQDAFPEAAREALAVSTRAEAGGDVMDRFGAFLRVQSGYRSLEEREGEDPDAVLSRAEARLREADIKAAVAALEALPEPGQEAMAGWIAEAERRLAAVDAAAALEPEAEAADEPAAEATAPDEPAADTGTAGSAETSAADGAGAATSAAGAGEAAPGGEAPAVAGPTGDAVGQAPAEADDAAAASEALAGDEPEAAASASGGGARDAAAGAPAAGAADADPVATAPAPAAQN